MLGKEKKPFKVNLHGNMVSIGAKYAVAEVVGKKFSGWPATLLTVSYTHLDVYKRQTMIQLISQDLLIYRQFRFFFHM